MILDDLRLLLLIVERGGMAAAGRELGLAPATVSTRLASLEEHYGARLINRTTRSLSPTEEGLIALEGARRLLAEADELDARIRYGVSRIVGVVRITAPVDLGRNWLVPLLDEFLAEHPDVELDLRLSDGCVDLAGDGIDLALRIGDLQDSSLIARKLVDCPRVVCAAPDYLERRGIPSVPADVQSHDCLLMRFGDELNHRWRFRVGTDEQEIRVRGRRAASDGELIRRWCLAGHGLARKSLPDVATDLATGHLVRVLADYEVSPVPLQVIYSTGQHMPRRVRLLVERIVERRETLREPSEVVPSRLT